MSRWGYMEITRTCVGCGANLPVNGPLERIRCASCFTVNPIPMRVYQQVLEIIEDGRVQATDGEVTTQTPLTAGGVYQLTWGIHAPRCSDCGTDLTDASNTEGDFACPGCGVTCTSFAPTDMYARLFPAVRQVVLGDRPSEEVKEAQQQVSVDQSGTKPILMSCDSCGGSLSVTAATPRLHDCQYCGARVGIPPDLWERLHPAESTRGWYVRLEGPLEEPSPEARREMSRLYDEQSLGEAEHREGPSRWARIQVALKCSECSEHVPVNGLLPHVICGSCGTLREIPSDHHVDFLSWVNDDQPVFDGTAIKKGGYRYQMKCTREPPVCTVCDTPLPLVEPGQDVEIRCTGCTARYPTFPVPEELAKQAGRARQLYCAQKAPDPPPSQVPAQLEFGCTACGADLSITPETGRIHHCEYCQSDVFLPDRIWTQLHPVTRVQPWYVDAVAEPPPKRPSTDPDDMIQQTIDHGQRQEGKIKILGYVILGAALLAGALVFILGGC